MPSSSHSRSAAPAGVCRRSNRPSPRSVPVPTITTRPTTAAPWPTPGSPEALHRWIRTQLGISIARTSLLAGSCAPFDYLTHAFFEGRVPGAAPGAQPARDAVVWANRGGGKTFLGALATLLDLVFKPGIEVRILGGSLEQSRRMLEHLHRFTQSESIAPLVAGRFTRSRLRLTNGSRAEVLAQSHTSVRGTRVQKLRCDEVDLFDRQVWEAAQLTTRSLACPGPWGDTVGGAVECLSTMHRPMGLMWDLVASATPRSRPVPGADRTLFRWGIVDALERCGPEEDCHACALQPECQGRAKDPQRQDAGHIARGDALAMKRRVSLAAWESEMLCLRPNRSHAVYPEFDASVHVSGERSGQHAASGTLVAGMDFGLRSPTVILWATVDDDGVVRITDEHVREGWTLDRHIERLHRAGRPKPAWIGIDPAGLSRNDQTGRSNATALRQAGLVVRARRTDLHAGIALVRARLQPASGGPRLFIHPRCSRLIECLQRYHYPQDRPESLDPVKDGHDHACDALRYLVINLDREAAGRGSYLAGAGRNAR